ncbi:MAG: hypothetical protein MI976_00075 [Pseudomonadales bacterium]|nr:hypothetical protein [Pseudomonadales bacterium]
MRLNNTTTPPLILWVAVLGLSVAILGTFLFLSTSIPKKTFATFRSSIPAESALLQTSDKKVFVIGTSLIRNGYDRNKRDIGLSALVGAAYMSAGAIEHLYEFQHVEGMDLVIIHTDMLINRRGSIAENLKKHFDRGFELTIDAIEGKNLYRSYPQLQDWKLKCAHRTTEKQQQIANKLNRYMQDSIPLRSDDLVLLEKIISQNKNVILLDILRSPETELKLVDSRQKWISYLSSLGKQYGISIIQYSHPIPSKHYCDGSHMNETARTKHDAWLRQKIQETIY